ncbi:MAG: allantoinase, partial [Chitinophagaceae bacterium]
VEGAVGERSNNERLKAALADGTLDLVASDHSPAPPAIKELESGNLLKAWGGIAGLQFLLPASWTALRGTLPLEQFIPLLTGAPARLLGLDGRKGFLRAGYDADLTIWQPEASFRADISHLEHRHKISPYLERELAGLVQYTFIGGDSVFSAGRLHQQPNGKWLFRK